MYSVAEVSYRIFFLLGEGGKHCHIGGMGILYAKISACYNFKYISLKLQTNKSMFGAVC